MEEHDADPSTMEGAPDMSGDDAQGATPMTQACGHDDPYPLDGTSPTLQVKAGADAPAMALASSWRSGYPGSSYTCAPSMLSGAWPGGDAAPAGVYHPYSSVPSGKDAVMQMAQSLCMGAAQMGAYGAAQLGYHNLHCAPAMAQLVLPMCARSPPGWPAPLAEATLSSYAGMPAGDEEDDDLRGASARKNAWSREEDDILARVVEQYGASKWTKVAAHLPGRMGKQCRERWFNHLTPEVKKGEWSPAEDELIMAAVQEHGTKWSVIVKQLPGRSDNAIKNRYYSAVRKASRQLGKRHEDTPGYALSRLESAVSSACGVSRALTAQAVVTAQAEAYLPVAQAAYAAPGVMEGGSPAEAVAQAAVQFGPSPFPGGTGHGMPAQPATQPAREGDAVAYPMKRQRFEHGAHAAFHIKTGGQREWGRAGEAFEMEQQEEDSAGMDDTVGEDSPSSPQALTDEHGRRWEDDTRDIPEAVAVVSSMPLTA